MTCLSSAFPAGILAPWRQELFCLLVCPSIQARSSVNICGINELTWPWPFSEFSPWLCMPSGLWNLAFATWRYRVHASGWADALGTGDGDIKEEGGHTSVLLEILIGFWASAMAGSRNVLQGVWRATQGWKDSQREFVFFKRPSSI